MDKSVKEYKEALMQIGMLLFLAATLILLLSYLMEKRDPHSVSDDGWTADFAFSTATPAKALGTEGGWWESVEEERSDSLPTMPAIELYATATQTPPSLTQTALALSPTVTATRTPLFDPNAALTPTATRVPTETKTQTPTGAE